MIARKVCRFSGFLLCIFFWQGSLFAQDPTPTPVNNQPAQIETELNLIHLGDLIEMEVVGNYDYYWRGTLTPEGFLRGPEAMAESIFALCRTEQEVGSEIARLLGKTLRNPQIVVRILDRSNRAATTVFGAVRAPQRFQIKRPVQLNELIVLSGGLTEKASGEIEVFRAAGLSCAEIRAQKATNESTSETKSERFISTSQSNGSKIINVKITDLLSGKKEANLQILSGDVVTVQEAKPIYVIGGVTTPKQIATRSEITVSRAIASAGGLTKDADGKRVTIFRRAGGSSQIIEVDLDKIEAKQAADIVLQPFDIVDVPHKGREKRKFPPVVKVDDASGANPAKLPLRVID